jgi:hypothetical protein
VGLCDVHIRTLRYLYDSEVPVMYTLTRLVAVWIALVSCWRLPVAECTVVESPLACFGWSPSYAVDWSGAKVTGLVYLVTIGAAKLVMDLITY